MKRLLWLMTLLPVLAWGQMIGPGAPLGSPTSITDAAGNVWTLAAGVVQIQPPGGTAAPAGVSSGVLLLVDSAGTMWQENNQCLWWSWSGTTWGQGAGAAKGPPGVPPCECYPSFPYNNVDYGFLPTGVSTRYDVYATWVCYTPTGYYTWANMGLLSNVASYALQMKLGLWTAAQARGDCAATCVAPTASEAAYQQLLWAKDQPIAVVAFNGASLTRSVYAANADGTLNPTPLPGVLVAVAAKCDPANKIITTPNPPPGSPDYFSVAGDANSLGGTILAGSFTVCVVALPIGAN